jgi:hypothetical protein
MVGLSWLCEVPLISRIVHDLASVKMSVDSWDSSERIVPKFLKSQQTNPRQTAQKQGQTGIFDGFHTRREIYRDRSVRKKSTDNDTRTTKKNQGFCKKSVSRFGPAEIGVEN